MKVTDYYLYKVYEVPLRELPVKAGKKFAKWVSQKVEKRNILMGAKELSDSDFLEALNRRYSSVKEFLHEFKIRREPNFFIDCGNKGELVEITNLEFPGLYENIIKESDKICDHVFNLLGSGEVCLGKKIDWHTDFKSHYRWAPKTYYKEIEYGHIKGVDVKVPWELSRFQHLPTLGKAYWYTGDEKYAREFVSQISNWIDTNPHPFGVNWTCTMDVAIRIVNWIWGFYFFGDSEELTEEFLLMFLKSILKHGRHIMKNLEYREINNNHYVSNIVGLVYLGVMFPEFKEARRWRDFGIKELIKEMENQAISDGVDYEGSISYHRLVTELFLSATILCLKNKIRFPEWYMKRLEKMIEFMMYYTKPDETAPQIGDADDGRLHILNNYGNWDSRNHKYLLCIGAILFDRFDFKQATGGMHEEAFWLLGEKGLEKFKTLGKKNTELKSKAFVDGGFYIMRHNKLYMIVDCIPHAHNVPSGHKHNSSLSFELYAINKTFIVDPGAYIYTPYPEWRNRFRSTSYHNTVTVDGKEQNRFYPKKMFSMRRDANIKVNQWEVSDEYDFLDVQHSGYERLTEPITHQRQITFNKKDGYWVIKDILTGKGQHTFDLYFHFAPMKLRTLFEHQNVLAQIKKIRSQLIGNLVQIDESLVVETNNNDGVDLLVIPLEAKNLSVDIVDGWVSYSYGTKTKASVIKYSKIVQCPTQFLTLLYPFMNNKKGAYYESD